MPLNQVSLQLNKICECFLVLDLWTHLHQAWQFQQKLVSVFWLSHSLEVLLIINNSKIRYLIQLYFLSVKINYYYLTTGSPICLSQRNLIQVFRNFHIFLFQPHQSHLHHYSLPFLVCFFLRGYECFHEAFNFVSLFHGLTNEQAMYNITLPFIIINKLAKYIWFYQNWWLLWIQNYSKRFIKL